MVRLMFRGRTLVRVGLVLVGKGIKVMVVGRTESVKGEDLDAV